MIDIANEHLCRLVDAPMEIPSKPHISTVVRWTRQGVKGVRLETVVIGGRRFTSLEAIQRFIQARNVCDVHEASCVTDGLGN
jgi:Protein of unknown function (DUF1580)